MVHFEIKEKDSLILFGLEYKISDIKIWVMAHNNKSNLNMKINMNMNSKGDLDKSHDNRNNKVGLMERLIYPLKAVPPSIIFSDIYTERQKMLLKNGWPVHAFDKPVEIRPQIWLSGIAFDEDLPKWCKNKSFTHILNASGKYGRFFYYKTHPHDYNIKYLELDIDDMPQFELGPYLSKIYSFLYHAYEEKGKILIHCVWGQSRSVSCLIYFMMMYWGIKYDSILALIKKLRPCAAPNYGFELQLRMIDMSGCSGPHITMIPELLLEELV